MIKLTSDFELELVFNKLEYSQRRWPHVGGPGGERENDALKVQSYFRALEQGRQTGGHPTLLLCSFPSTKRLYPVIEKTLAPWTMKVSWAIKLFPKYLQWLPGILFSFAFRSFFSTQPKLNLWELIKICHPKISCQVSLNCLESN